MCGTGKTIQIINYINQNPDKKYLFITPFLTEIERIKKSCPNLKFEEPPVFGNKIQGLKYLLNKQKNIVSTHSLFRSFDQSVLDLTKFYDYTLIMDEVADIVEVVDATKSDIKLILEEYVSIDPNGKVHWTDDTYSGKFDCYKEMCELDSMYFYGNPKSGGAFIWMIPKQVFDSFKETFVLTYMFDYQLQKYYYDYNNIKYDKYYLLDDKLICGSLDYNGNKYKNLITVCDNHKMNKIGDDYYSLAMGWYKRNKTTVLINELRKNICNYFVNITKTKSKNNLWTTFKEYKTSLKGNGYSKGFAWLNIRAVNEYSNKIAIAYVVNRFMNPIIKNFFEQNGICINEDGYALSELIQFIFRSAVRNGKKVDVYIPSRRERELLLGWLNK